MAVLVLFSFITTQAGFIPSAFSFSPVLPAPLAQPNPSLSENRLAPNNTFTYADEATKTFAVFSNERGTILPLFVGRTEWREGRRQFVATRKITSWKNFYILTDPRDTQFLQIMERLPQGGFGRLLRHRGEGIDLEFLYHDKAGALTILDHQKGLFFRVDFKDKPQDPLALASREKDRTPVSELLALLNVSIKFFLFGAGFLPIPALAVTRIHSQNDLLTEEDLWLNRKVRGPPEGGLLS